jgi:NADH:ubiquinone oxidoreductase subunit 5 (subunit L)/multisubunit Na+/H+ antiporter MnhA subunit
LSLWATKDAVLAAALEQSPWLYAAGLVGAGLSAAYSGKMLWIIWRRVPAADLEAVRSHEDEEEPGSGEVNGLQRGPLVLLAVGAAVLGVLALPPLIGEIGSALGAPGTPESTVLELVVSATVAVLVLLALLRWRAPEPAWAVRWLGMERFAHSAVVRPTLRLAGALARFDDRVLDRGVDATSTAVLRLARRSGGADNRYVDGAAEWVGAQARSLGRLARRPQTGQLYQYYLQAVVVLGVGLALLVMVR